MRASRLFSWLKRGAVAAVLLAIAGAIGWSLLPRPAPVETAVIRRGPLAVTVEEGGRARVQDRYVVTAPLAGTLARIELHPGDPVAAGAVLARIAPLPPPLLDARSRSEVDGRVAVARARQKQAATGVQRAEANRRYADTELARTQALGERGAVPRAELERQQLAADLAARELESARFGAAIAADELATANALAARLGRRPPADEELVVRAPVPGRVLRVLAASEGAVGPGTPLVELGDPDRLEVVIDVLTADAAVIPAGAAVTLSGWGGAPLRGTVRLVEPSATTRVSALGVEEQRVAVIVDLLDPPAAWRGLGDGWRVEASIVTWSAPDVVLVPLAAVFRDGAAWAVYLVDGGRAHLRHVELGRRGATDAEVVAGLTAGQRVVFHPGERIADGTRVDAR